METHDDWHWKAAADGYLREDEHETFEFLRQLQATLERLVLQKPPYTRIDPPESPKAKAKTSIADLVEYQGNGIGPFPAN